MRRSWNLENRLMHRFGRLMGVALAVQDAGYTDTGISLRIRNAIDTKKAPHWKDEGLTAGGTLTLAYDHQLNGQAIVGSSAPATLAEALKTIQAWRHV